MSSLLFVLAEVMDKEPSIAALWAWGLGIGLLGLSVARWRWWAALPVLFFALAFCYSVLSELFDPFVGPQIRKEAGLGYFVGAMVAGLVSLALPSLGLLVRGRRANPTHQDVPRDT